MSSPTPEEDIANFTELKELLRLTCIATSTRVFTNFPSSPFPLLVALTNETYR